MKKVCELISNNLVSSIVLISAIGIITFTYFKMDINDIKFDADNSYDLLTVNTIFAGFLYTMLGNMVEFSSRPHIASKDKAGYIDKYFSPIYFGLFFFLLSIFLDIMILFFNWSWKIKALIFLSRSFSLVGVIYFIISSFMLRKVINQLRNK